MSQDLATRLPRLRAHTLPGRLLPGQELWADNPHRLAAQLTVAKRRGEVAELGRWELHRGRHVALVLRLKRGVTWRTRARRWALLGLLGLALGYGLVWFALQLLGVVGWLGVPAAMLILAASMRSGHRPACVGLHCPGCRG